MIRPDHAVVRAMAEEMAREMHDSYATIHRGYAAWDDLPDYEATLTTEAPDYEGARVIGSPRRIYVDAHVRLLLDLTRPASRDAWVRWLAGNQTDLGDLALNLRRDNPTALEAAVCAALETA